MTVQEWFEGDRIYRDDLQLVAEESEYQAGASKFILENWETDAEDLTPKQSSWAGRILDDLVERRITKGGIR